MFLGNQREKLVGFGESLVGRTHRSRLSALERDERHARNAGDREVSQPIFERPQIRCDRRIDADFTDAAHVADTLILC